MDVAVGLRFGADRQVTHGRRCGRNQLSGSGHLGPRRGFSSLPAEAEAGARLHDDLSPL
jgi:hypothetical protein